MPADASALRMKVRNRAAEAVRIAGRDLRDDLARATPRSDTPGTHMADRWTVDFSARSPTVFVATIQNKAETESGIPLVTIIDKGRREVRPVRAKVLRWYGPNGAVFSAKSKAVAGTGFYSERMTGAHWVQLLQAGWRQAA